MGLIVMRFQSSPTQENLKYLFFVNDQANSVLNTVGDSVRVSVCFLRKIEIISLHGTKILI